MTTLWRFVCISYLPDGQQFPCRCIVDVFPIKTMARHFPLLYIHTIILLLCWGLNNNTFITPHPSPSEKKTNLPIPSNPPKQKNHPPSQMTNQPTTSPQTPKALLPWPCSSTSWPWTPACGTTVVPSRHRRRRRWCAAWPGKCNGALKRRHQRLRGALGMVELHMIS